MAEEPGAIREPTDPKPLSPFIVLIPTFDLYGYLPLVQQLFHVAMKLERPPFIVITDRWGVWHSLQEATKKVEERLSVTEFRGLIVGSDTHLVNPEVLAAYVEKADRERFNFVANVHMRGSDLEGIDGGYAVNEEVPDLAVVKPKGYGLYYGWLSTRYKWHSDAFAEESARFMEDNKIEVRFAKGVKVLHFVRRYI